MNAGSRTGHDLRWTGWLSAILILNFSFSCAPRTMAGGNGPGTVLATTTVLADIARQVAGDRLRVESLLPAGSDPHTFQVTPTDLVRITDSSVLIANGAGYERFLTPIFQDPEREGLTIDASAGLSALQGVEFGANLNPHLWLDPNNVIEYVGNIERGLSQAFPDAADVFAANASAYVAQLSELDRWIEERVAAVPPERRLLVTNHEALRYFADRYGFRIAATILTSVSTDASVSAHELSAVVNEIRASQVPAVFLDVMENDNLARQISSETGVRIVDDLYLESLSAGPPAGTYIDMMRHNVTRIVESLQ